MPKHVEQGIEFDNSQAHSALYDTERTAELYCLIVNRWQQLGGWPLAPLENTDTELQVDDIDSDDAKTSE